MNKLENLIMLFATRMDKFGFTRTEIMKLVYLFEYYYKQTYQMSFSNTKFIRYHYGPFAFPVLEKVDELENKDYLKMDIKITYNQKNCYVYKSNNNKSYEVIMDGNVLYIADFILNKYNDMSLNELIEWSYSTPPMEEILDDEGELENLYNGRRIDMSKNKGTKKFSLDEIKEAGKRADRSSRGSNKDYYRHVLSIHQEMAPLRRRANECLEKK